ncbi:hypothetical protein [Bosea sp. FBZP-16]|uniref:hypothetical protein n=1 Tax=Bosea sp. FBZP-16 TaxID=2065382 RepID=UPI000C30FF22|nr:hypothetical protein [Bosea sp. FBZP-16]
MRLKRAKDPGNQPRRRTIDLFPAFRYSSAFDICVSAAGYNAFHENLLGAIPTIFVPNEAEEMDLQLVRAKYAEVWGWRCCCAGTTIAIGSARWWKRCSTIALETGSDCAASDLIGAMEQTTSPASSQWPRIC